ncbi:MAG: hypothetical protein ACYC27_05405 [Armatimonadota bacterium]
MRTLTLCVYCSLLAAMTMPQTDAAQAGTVGLYAFTPAPEYYKYWRACGYNMLQFIDHTYVTPEGKARDEYYARMSKSIDQAQKAGFKVWIIELSNVLSNDSGFDPLDQAAMDKRLKEIESGAKGLSNADGFVFFGGDPGGSPKDMGAAGVPAWVEMTRKVHDIIKREAPKSQFNANIWAVTAWEYIGTNPFKAVFWEKEVAYGKQIVNEKNFIGPDCGIEFVPHNYYRSLALKAYDDAKIEPELYPTASEVKKLKDRGTKRVWAWAHFLIDEIDDGYTGYSGVKSHPAQGETRYICKFVRDMQGMGMNGVISNSGGPDAAIEALNVYAFARFCTDPSATPEQVIDDFAGFISEDATQSGLIQVLRFIENHSTWQASIPEQHRLPNFSCRFKSAKSAIAALDKVTPRDKPGMPLSETPSKYLQRLRDRLQDIAISEEK